MQPLQRVIASAYAAIVTTISIAGLTIATDVFPGVKQWLTMVSGHHWVSKSLLSVAIYLLIFAAVQSSSVDASPAVAVRAAHRLFLTTSIAVLVVTGFFLGEFLGWFS